MIFRREMTLKLARTDAAGVLYFARQFDLIHEVYEEFMTELGYGLERLIADDDWFISIIHAESDYIAPIRFGDRLAIELSVQHIGNSSYVIDYRLLGGSGGLVGTSRTVHVSIDLRHKGKIQLPDGLKQALSRYRSPGGAAA